MPKIPRFQVYELPPEDTSEANTTLLWEGFVDRVEDTPDGEVRYGLGTDDHGEPFRMYIPPRDGIGTKVCFYSVDDPEHIMTHVAAIESPTPDKLVTFLFFREDDDGLQVIGADAAAPRHSVGN